MEIQHADKKYAMAKRILIFILLIHTVLFIWAVYEQSFTTSKGRYILLADDAMISMKYAYNLVHHGQLVWQQGQKVMGITNPGWTAIMALTLLINLPLRIASLPIVIINLLVDLLLIIIVFKAILKCCGFPSAVIFGGFLSVLTPLIFFSTLGLETPLQTLLVTSAIISVIPKENSDRLVDYPLRTFLILAAATIVRPDSGLFLLLFSVAAIRDAIVLRQERAKIIRVMSISGSIIAAMLLAQKIYYGDWLPNTFYLKATGGAKSIYWGWKYFLKGLVDDGIIPIFVFAAIGIIEWICKRNTRDKGIVVAIIVLVWLGYIIWTGGDSIPHSRFFLPVLPLVFICGANGLKTIMNIFQMDDFLLDVKIARRKLFLNILTALTIIATFIVLIIPLIRLKLVHPHFIDRVFVAESLQNAKLPRNTTIALFEAGTIPFLLPRFEFYDLLGKNDRYIARTKAHYGLVGHNKWDFDYSLGKFKPDIIITRDNYTGITDDFAKNILANVDTLSGDCVLFPLSLWVHPLFVKYYRDNRLPIETPFGTHWTFARGKN